MQGHGDDTLQLPGKTNNLQVGGWAGGGFCAAAGGTEVSWVLPNFIGNSGEGGGRETPGLSWGLQLVFLGASN